jgi:hypothetical protein
LEEKQKDIILKQETIDNQRVTLSELQFSLQEKESELSKLQIKFF